MSAEEGSVAKSASVQEEEHKEGFSSYGAYIMMLIGCAVGFGNVWRYPFLVYRYGGLAFIIAYIIMLIVVVWPSAILEMALGQICRGGPIHSWSKLGYRARSPGIVGWVAFNICTYYPMLLIWSLMYFCNAFKTDLPWRTTDDDVERCGVATIPSDCVLLDNCMWRKDEDFCTINPIAVAKDFFHNGVYAYLNTDKGEHRYHIIGISGWNVICAFVTWLANVLSLIAGAKVLGYIMYVTMTLPIIFIIILLIVGATLDGAREGVKSYIAKFDGSKLKMDAWLDAVAQGVFSVGVAQGTMAACTAHNQRGQNFVCDAVITMVADTLYAVAAGFAVFSVIGYLGNMTGQAVEDLPVSGISLAFMTYPVGLTHVPGVGANILTVIFFATLWLIGMDTLVGLAEALILMVCHSRLGTRLGLKHWHMTLGLSFFFFILPGMLLSTNMGYSMLDAMDNYSTMSQAWGAGCECAIAGWLYLNTHVCFKTGALAYWIHGLTFHLGALVCALLTSIGDVPTGQKTAGICVGVIFPIGGLLVAALIAKKYDERGNYLTYVDRLYYLSMYNIEPLRKCFNDEGCSKAKFFRLPLIWSILVKYIVPYIIMYLTFSGLCDQSKMYSRPIEAEEPYPWFIFLIGQLSPWFMVFCIFLFTIFPNTMLPLLPPGVEDEPVLAEELLVLFDRKPGAVPFDPEKGEDEVTGHEGK